VKSKGEGAPSQQSGWTCTCTGPGEQEPALAISARRRAAVRRTRTLPRRRAGQTSRQWQRIALVHSSAVAVLVAIVGVAAAAATASVSAGRSARPHTRRVRAGVRALCPRGRGRPHWLPGTPRSLAGPGFHPKARVCVTGRPRGPAPRPPRPSARRLLTVASRRAAPCFLALDHWIAGREPLCDPLVPLLGRQLIAEPAMGGTAAVAVA
jgi:hypothetical protein